MYFSLHVNQLVHQANVRVTYDVIGYVADPRMIDRSRVTAACASVLRRALRDGGYSQSAFA